MGVFGVEVIGIVVVVLWLVLVGGYFIVMLFEGGVCFDSF